LEVVKNVVPLLESIPPMTDVVVDIGCGSAGAASAFTESKVRLRIDPLADWYILVSATFFL
jgi:hypothetical protein